MSIGKQHTAEWAKSFIDLLDYVYPLKHGEKNPPKPMPKTDHKATTMKTTLTDLIAAENERHSIALSQIIEANKPDPEIRSVSVFELYKENRFNVNNELYIGDNDLYRLDEFEIIGNGGFLIHVPLGLKLKPKESEPIITLLHFKGIHGKHQISLRMLADFSLEY